jgi:hypothetical protein
MSPADSCHIRRVFKFFSGLPLSSACIDLMRELHTSLTYVQSWIQYDE